MALTLVTSMAILMDLAKKEGEAFRKFTESNTEGNLKAYLEAKEEHEAYKQLAIESDSILV